MQGVEVFANLDFHKKNSISVAMATYNGEMYLQEQLDSIASQSVPPLELVVCDDGSVDKTLEILENFKEKALFPVHIFKNESNLGSTLNFDKAIRLCCGDVIVLCDQDDIWRDDKLEKVEDCFRTEDSSVVGFYSDAELIDGSGNNLSKKLWSSLGFSVKKQKKLQLGGILAFNLLLKRTYVTGAAFAFRRKSFLKTSGCISGSWVHDAWISVNIIREGGIRIFPECLTFYRQHQSNQIGVKRKTMRELIFKERVVDEINNLECLKHTLINSNVSEDYLSVLDLKISHLKVRSLKNKSIFPLLNELISGNYFKYSGGLSSFSKDVFHFLLK